MPVTQQDIANHLGLSKMSVRRALSGYPNVKESTRRRIETVARELGYTETSNPEARALAARRHGRRAQTGNIGCVWLDSDDGPLPYYMHLQQGIQRAAQRAGREVLLVSPEPAAGWERVDGIIGHGERSNNVPGSIGVALPFVSLMVSKDASAAVLADDYDGAKQATEHLLSLGHRRIGILADLNSGPVPERVRAYREVLAQAGTSPRKQWQRLLWDWGPMELRGRMSMEAWLEDGFPQTGITALLVQNDRAAIGAMQALQAAGVRVPADVSIVGFDSTDECELSTPRLTSVRVPFEEIGAKAVELLLMQIREGEEELEPQNVVLPVELEIRESTAPPRTEI